MIEKSKEFIATEAVGYMPGAVSSATIVKKPAGDITLMSFDVGTGLPEKISPFDSFIQVIEGAAEIIIDRKPKRVISGEAIIIPAHAKLIVQAAGRFKMVRTVIKGGYEL